MLSMPDTSCQLMWSAGSPPHHERGRNREYSGGRLRNPLSMQVGHWKSICFSPQDEDLLLVQDEDIFQSIQQSTNPPTQPIVWI